MPDDTMRIGSVNFVIRAYAYVPAEDTFRKLDTNSESPTVGYLIATPIPRAPFTMGLPVCLPGGHAVAAAAACRQAGYLAGEPVIAGGEGTGVPTVGADTVCAEARMFAERAGVLLNGPTHKT